MIYHDSFCNTINSKFYKYILVSINFISRAALASNQFYFHIIYFFLYFYEFKFSIHIQVY